MPGRSSDLLKQDEVMEQSVLIERLRAQLGRSPNVDRNIALVKDYLGGKTYAAIAKAHGLSSGRVAQIIQKAHWRLGGGIVRGQESNGPGVPRNVMVEQYPYVWNLTVELGMTRQTAWEFYKALQRAGSLEALAGRLSQLSGNHSIRRIAKEVFLRENKDIILPEAAGGGLSRGEFNRSLREACKFVGYLEKAGLPISNPANCQELDRRLVSLVELMGQRKSGGSQRPEWLTGDVVKQAAHALGACLAKR